MEQIISIFDWDDTLCPSSWLGNEGFIVSNDGNTTRGRLKPEHYTMGGLVLVETQICQLLERAARVGYVYIISAAELKWVHSTCRVFFPKLTQMLLQSADKISIVSARDWYLERFGLLGTTGPGAWKLEAFSQLWYMHYNPALAYLYLISIGDSPYEHEACRSLCASTSQLQHKTLKFIEKPSLEQLFHQLQATISTLDHIYCHIGSLDLQLIPSCDSSSAFRVVTTDIHPPHCTP